MSREDELASQIIDLRAMVEDQDAEIKHFEEHSDVLEAIVRDQREKIAVLEKTLRAVSEAIEAVSDCLKKPNPAICDTIWVDGITTAADILDHQIDVIDGKLGGQP